MADIMYIMRDFEKKSFHVIISDFGSYHSSHKACEQIFITNEC